MTEARRLLVIGRVQGVFFREWTRQQAAELGLSGWVRNRRDGRVEILASGEAEALDELERRCRSGPPSARVEKVEVALSDEPAPTGFERRPTV